MKKGLITTSYILFIIASAFLLLKDALIIGPNIKGGGMIEMQNTAEILFSIAILIYSIVQLVRFKKNDDANQYRSFGVISILISFLTIILIFFSFDGVITFEELFPYKFFTLLSSFMGLGFGIAAVTNNEKAKTYGAYNGAGILAVIAFLSFISVLLPFVFGYGPYKIYISSGNFVYGGTDLFLFLIVKILIIVASILLAVNFYQPYRKLFPRKNRLFGNRNSGSTQNKSTENKSSNIPSSKEEAMEKYGMTEEEAELLFPTENKVEVPTAQERSEQLMKEAANRQNSTHSESGAGLGVGYGLGLNVSQTQQSPSQSAKNADPNAVAELKREYLQGKLTKEEFNARLAELRK